MTNASFLPDHLSALRDELMSCLIGLARAAYSKPKDDATAAILLQALAVSAESADDAEMTACIRMLMAEKMRIAPGCAACESPCGATSNYDMQLLRQAAEDVRAAKLWVLYALFGMAVRLKSEGAAPSPAFQDFLIPAIALLAEDLTTAEIQPYALKLMRSTF